ncbi:vacuolar protein sorting 55 (VPS55) family protein [Striga asiatica]|uniref:Vacuolar protein sorting 55 (VPS55) family protein n=1 Tax=Striga asiatica TaxID=4170 RepID=A0A5A7PDV5_STRAF|nr:vacuolar protein sorting 55 (VPS55) family protein [Striga asiatica]
MGFTYHRIGADGARSLNPLSSPHPSRCGLPTTVLELTAPALRIHCHLLIKVDGHCHRLRGNGHRALPPQPIPNEDIWYTPPRSWCLCGVVTSDGGGWADSSRVHTNGWTAGDGGERQGRRH